jgi:hypothetical protein
MLYKITAGDSRLVPVPFHGFEHEGKLEKDLENLLAASLFETLYERALFPFRQEGPFQGVADIYALNASGDVVLFELKRSIAGGDALDQLLRYAQDAGQWKYERLARMYEQYREKDDMECSLRDAHRDAFNLDRSLDPHEFNRAQRMRVVGSAADSALVRAVNYWRNKELDIEFLPYRLYRLGEDLYFEFFSKPNDEHVNPAHAKGVLFDTNRTWDEGAFQRMIANQRVASYGDRKDAVRLFAPNDLVFYYHKGFGVVAAGRVAGHNVKSDGDGEMYWDVELLTRVPTEFDAPTALSISRLEEVTGRTFYWARIDKRPYLTTDESQALLTALREELGEN